MRKKKQQQQQEQSRKTETTENIRRQFWFNLGYHKNATWANSDGINTNLKYTLRK